MCINIEIPDSLADALNAKARAEGVSTSMYVRQVLDRELSKPSRQKANSKKSAYGLPAKYGPGPSAEEIDESRREMLSGFGTVL